ncbi:DUF6602 domain-containing protein, partial [Bradyrhizobium sp. 33ap4]|uniref:DUF6602 domain-containing protein n=1 Tax=Bradyrhizobium sp. 33ap4 TaxID=3061630 RepID=UPI0029319F28
MKKHDFFNLMSAVKESLNSAYLRIRARSKDDPGTAGDQAEEDWAEILRDWLPATYRIVTKGRILFADGSSSPQVDILVLTPSYPRGLGPIDIHCIQIIAAARWMKPVKLSDR